MLYLSKYFQALHQGINVLSEEILFKNLLRFLNGIAVMLRKSVGDALFPFCPPELTFFRVSLLVSFWFLMIDLIFDCGRRLLSVNWDRGK